MSPIPREINYFARDTLFRGFFGKVITELGSIPVARENLEAKSLKAVFKVLKAGGTIAIYPEGTRSPKGDLMEPKAGVGMIALKSKSIVVPSRIFGAYEAFNCSDRIPKIGGRIHITYGLPVSVQELDPGKDHPNRYLEASTRIMSKIASLNLPEQTVI